MFEIILNLIVIYKFSYVFLWLKLMIDDQIFKYKNLHDFNTRQTLLCLTDS